MIYTDPTGMTVDSTGGSGKVPGAPEPEKTENNDKLVPLSFWRIANGGESPLPKGGVSINGAFPNGTLQPASHQNARIGPAKEREFGSHFSPEEKAAQLGVNIFWAVEGGYNILKGGFNAVSSWFSAGKEVQTTIQYTKSSLELGQQMHNMYKVGQNGVKEFQLVSGKRIDFLDIENGIIYELKPFNPRAMKQGYRQLATPAVPSLKTWNPK